MDDVNLVVVHGIGEMERGDNTNQNQTNMNAMYTVQNPTIEVTDECIFLSYSYQEKYDRNTKLLTIPLNKICSFKVDSFKLPRGIDKPRLIILVCD
jgi:hypothetical protein